MRALSGRPSVFSSTARFLRDHMAWLNQGLQLRRWVALYTSTSDETKGARWPMRAIVKSGPTGLRRWVALYYE